MCGPLWRKAITKKVGFSVTRLSEEALKKFTKEELVYFLKKIEFYLPTGKTDSIEYCILNKRHADLSKEIDNIFSKVTKSLEEYKNTQNFDKLIEVQKLNEQRERLWNKQRKIEKELWGV